MKSPLLRLLFGFVTLAFFCECGGATAVVGQPAPNFSLCGADGRTYSLSDFTGKYIVLEWTNPDCPFVHKHYDGGNMQKLQKQYIDKGIVWFSICSSAPGKSGGDYSAAQIQKILADRQASPTAYLFDPTGSVGRSYGAKTTPDLFVLNSKGVVIYSGAIDSISSPDASDIPRATNYVAQALDESLSGRPVSVSSTKSYGCGVHY